SSTWLVETRGVGASDVGHRERGENGGAGRWIAWRPPLLAAEPTDAEEPPKIPQEFRSDSYFRACTKSSCGLSSYGEPASKMRREIHPSVAAGETEPMITLLGSPRLCCDGLTRRETLKAGALSLLGGFFNLPSLLALERSGSPLVQPGKAKSVLLIYLQGGPATQDMFDLKPDAPAGIRSEFKPIAT